MAKVDARQCDGCEDLVRASEITTKRTTYRGAVNGYYTRDLCKTCVDGDLPDGVELTEPKKSSGGSTSDEATPPL